MQQKNSCNNELKQRGERVMAGVREAQSWELNCAQWDREMVPRVQGLAWQEGYADWEEERTAGRVPPTSAVENLVLTEKGDLDEDKYSPQVKTSHLLDKDSKELWGMA